MQPSLVTRSIDFHTPQSLPLMREVARRSRDGGRDLCISLHPIIAFLRDYCDDLPKMFRYFLIFH